MRLPRFTVRRMMVVTFLLAVAIVSLKWVTDPLEMFYWRTGLRRAIGAKVVSTGFIGNYQGTYEFRLVFDADREAVAAWLARRPSGDWRGWHSGPFPPWVTSRCSYARQIFGRIPMDRPGSSTVHFVFQDSPIGDHHGDLIVIDDAIGRVWYLSWCY